MPEVVTVGVAGPFSGPRAAYGDLLRRTVMSASPGLCLEWGDDAADASRAARVARRFIERGVSAVVGHFNSECARVAGALYRSAGIPFLMPASTAPDLCAGTGGYRLCPCDSRQVDTLSTWLRQRQARVVELWCDGSAYGRRLSSLLEERYRPSVGGWSGEAVVALMGNHVAVAAELRRRPARDVLYLVPDDCAVDEFDQLLASSDACVALPVAVPDYAACVTLAIRLIEAAQGGRQDIARHLALHPDFSGGQYCRAQFHVDMRHYTSPAPCPAISSTQASHENR